MTPPPSAAGAAPSTAPARRPVGPRRVSGPARRPVTSVPPPRPVLRQGVSRLVDHPVLDRLIRGRTWIGIVAFALIGIVAMQVALLKLNAGIGHSVARAASLQRANSLLNGQVAVLRASDLRQAEAAHQGMVYAPPGDVRYLTAGRGDAGQAAASVVAPRTPGAVTAGGSSGLGSGGSSGLASGGSSGLASSGSSTASVGSSSGAGTGSDAGSQLGAGSGGGAGTPSGSRGSVGSSGAGYAGSSGAPSGNQVSAGSPGAGYPGSAPAPSYVQPSASSSGGVVAGSGG